MNVISAVIWGEQVVLFRNLRSVGGMENDNSRTNY